MINPQKRSSKSEGKNQEEAGSDYSKDNIEGHRDKEDVTISFTKRWAHWRAPVGIVIYLVPLKEGILEERNF
jgi:hypothetical protein